MSGSVFRILTSQPHRRSDGRGAESGKVLEAEWAKAESRGNENGNRCTAKAVLSESGSA